jgi:hypothetical protein
MCRPTFKKSGTLLCCGAPTPRATEAIPLSDPLIGFLSARAGHTVSLEPISRTSGAERGNLPGRKRDPRGDGGGALLPLPTQARRLRSSRQQRREQERRTEMRSSSSLPPCVGGGRCRGGKQSADGNDECEFAQLVPPVPRVLWPKSVAVKALAGGYPLRAELGDIGRVRHLEEAAPVGVDGIDVVWLAIDLTAEDDLPSVR